MAETDLLVLLFGVVLAGLWFMPRLSAYERMLWLWLGIPMLMAFFFTEKPRTHVYVFFIPWALLAGMMVERAVEWLKQELAHRVADVAAVGLATVAVLLFGSYAYWFFIHHQVQVLRTWQENRPAGFWTVYDEPDTRGIFGFPFANGWKVAGLLYQEGILSGHYSTNEHDSWFPAWYTRGQVRCDADADWFLQAAHLDEFGQTAEYRETIKRYLSEVG